MAPLRVTQLLLFLGRPLREEGNLLSKNSQNPCEKKKMFSGPVQNILFQRTGEPGKKKSGHFARTLSLLTWK
jgi:hypothetical protein